MAEYMIQGETLTAIADAIREKSGSSAALSPSEMAGAIAEIQAGGGGVALCNVRVFKQGFGLGGGSQREVIGMDFSNGEAIVFQQVLSNGDEISLVMQKNSLLQVVGEYGAFDSNIVQSGSATVYPASVNYSDTAAVLIQGDCVIDLS